VRIAPPPLEPERPADDDRLPAQLRGLGPVGILGTILALALAAVLGPLKSLPVLLWAALSGTGWEELGFRRGRRVGWTVLASLGFGIALKLALKSVVLPLLGADPVNHAYHFLVGNRAALPGVLFMVIVGAGFGEELLFRSFLFLRLEAGLGRGVGARAAIVLLTTAVFAAAHLPDQGRVGAEQAAVVGLAFGTIYVLTRQIWPLMIAHAAFDVTAVAIIYWNLEARFAHLFFR